MLFTFLNLLSFKLITLLGIFNIANYLMTCTEILDKNFKVDLYYKILCILMPVIYQFKCMYLHTNRNNSNFNRIMRRISCSTHLWYSFALKYLTNKVLHFELSCTIFFLLQKENFVAYSVYKILSQSRISKSILIFNYYFFSNSNEKFLVFFFKLLLLSIWLLRSWFTFIIFYLAYCS